MERSAGIRDERLEVSDFPSGFEHWAQWFFELRGAEAITFRDIQAYQEVRGIKFSPIEVDGILAMDRAASAVVAEILKESV